MHIQELILLTQHLAEQKAFYGRTLGLPLLAETSASFMVQAGTTRLHFQETQQDVLYHVAFTIPRNTFSEAKSWLLQRVPLLTGKNGEEEFFFDNINARSLYFRDAASNILELIVHYDLEQEATGDFGASAFLHVSEIGLPVEDVTALAALLKDQLNIDPYPASRPILEGFAFMGDIYGQLVVVKIGRPWLPTETVHAAVAPVHLTISGSRERQVQLSPYPYVITVAEEA
jgi:catechol 2,3-dioxygenase-like lactoylglutathione lyase family enzyme